MTLGWGITEEEERAPLHESETKTVTITLGSGDFRFDYVLSYTSRDLPPVYLISAFWAGQEGTYLLWALLAALIGYFLSRRNGWEPAAVMSAYVPTIGFLLVLMLNSGGNPFRMVATPPPDGYGLNPLLQDPWMATHPPLMFLGYAALTVPAVLALVFVLALGLAFHAATLAGSRIASCSLGWRKTWPVTAEMASSRMNRRSVQYVILYVLSNAARPGQTPLASR